MTEETLDELLLKAYQRGFREAIEKAAKVASKHIPCGCPDPSCERTSIAREIRALSVAYPDAIRRDI